jgi:short-subunit dehydrogenase
MKHNSKKTALITGANSDIAIAIAEMLVNSNYNLILTSKTASKLRKTAEKIRSKNPSSKVKLIPADLASIQEINKLVSKIKKSTASVDLIFNNAGIYHDNKIAFSGIDFRDYTQNQILENLNVGFVAPVTLIHQLVGIMPQGSRIINISGTFESGAKGWLPYYLSKKGLENLTVGLSDELEEKKILVNCISPSDTYTSTYKKFFPQYANKNSCLDPHEIAEMVKLLISERGNRVNGQILEMRR